MRKMTFLISLAVVAFLAFSGLSQTRSNTAAKQDMNHTMEIALSGGAEVPGPGDTNGSGMAHLTFNHDKGEVCYDITAKDIQTPTAAHIHMAEAGKSGPVKIPLKKGADGNWKGCATADKSLINDIMKNPGNYYVNVHTAEFPNGAIRGQLGK